MLGVLFVASLSWKERMNYHQSGIVGCSMQIFWFEPRTMASMSMVLRVALLFVCLSHGFRVVTGNLGKHLSQRFFHGVRNGRGTGKVLTGTVARGLLVYFFSENVVARHHFRVREPRKQCHRTTLYRIHLLLRCRRGAHRYGCSDWLDGRRRSKRGWLWSGDNLFQCITQADVQQVFVVLFRCRRGRRNPCQGNAFSGCRRGPVREHVHHLVVFDGARNVVQ
mmetsp:Transcript_28705/g.61597  ORF Transcript_28705/g.61597 Transcript_28705/m.61597 type:complete len:222 (+) Transcript_28705:114-779(+)